MMLWASGGLKSIDWEYDMLGVWRPRTMQLPPFLIVVVFRKHGVGVVMIVIITKLAFQAHSVNTSDRDRVYKELDFTTGNFLHTRTLPTGCGLNIVGWVSDVVDSPGLKTVWRSADVLAVRRPRTIPSFILTIATHRTRDDQVVMNITINKSTTRTFEL
jgi:hypothetical protein